MKATLGIARDAIELPDGTALYVDITTDGVRLVLEPQLSPAELSQMRVNHLLGSERE